MSRIRPSARTGRTTTEPGWVMTSRVARTPLGSMTLSRRIPKIGPSYTVMLLRTLAFTKCGVPEDFFIFVVLAQIRTAHDTQKRAIRHVQPSASLVCLRRWGTPILGVWDFRGGGRAVACPRGCP